VILANLLLGTVLLAVVGYVGCAAWHLRWCMHEDMDKTIQTLKQQQEQKIKGLAISFFLMTRATTATTHLADMLVTRACA
jgi:hypothetical protein